MPGATLSGTPNPEEHGGGPMESGAPPEASQNLPIYADQSLESYFVHQIFNEELQRAVRFRSGTTGSSPLQHLAVTQLAQQWVRRHMPAVEIGEIAILAADVLEDKEKAAKWLSEPNVATDNVPPIELLGDAAGYDRVKNLLLRIEYGVLA